MSDLYKLLLLVTLLFFTSCNDENFAEDIIGDWSVEATRAITCTDDDFNFPWTNTMADECLSTSSFQIFTCLISMNLRSDGTVSFRENSFGEITTYEDSYILADDKVYFCLNEGDDLSTCSFGFIEDGKLFLEIAQICEPHYRLIKN